MNVMNVAIIAGALAVLFGGQKMKTSENEKRFTPLLAQAETKHGIPPGILKRMAWVESRYNPDALGPVTKAGRAVGIMQIMPSQHPGIDAKNPEIAIDYAGKYLAQLARMFKGNWKDAVAAYNAGPGTMQQVRAGKRKMPTETANYIRLVFGG